MGPRQSATLVSVLRASQVGRENSKLLRVKRSVSETTTCQVHDLKDDAQASTTTTSMTTTVMTVTMVVPMSSMMMMMMMMMMMTRRMTRKSRTGCCGRQCAEFRVCGSGGCSGGSDAHGGGEL